MTCNTAIYRVPPTDSVCTEFSLNAEGNELIGYIVSTPESTIPGFAASKADALLNAALWGHWGLSWQSEVGDVYTVQMTSLRDMSGGHDVFGVVIKKNGTTVYDTEWTSHPRSAEHLARLWLAANCP